MYHFFVNTPKASVTHSRFLLPFLMRPFPIEFYQKWDQDPVIRGRRFKNLYLKHDNNPILFRKRPNSAVLSRIHPDSPVLNPSIIQCVVSAW